jgi:ATP-dependent Lon protease
MAMDVDESQLVPILPMRSGVLFPHVGTPITVARPGSLLAIENASKRFDRHIALFRQRDGISTPRGASDLHPIGTLAELHSVQQLDKMLIVVVHGVDRAALGDLVFEGEMALASLRRLPVDLGRGPRIEALCREVIGLVRQLVQLHEGDPEIVTRVMSSEDPVRIAYAIASMVGLNVEDAQHVLEMDRLDQVLEWLVEHLSRELQTAEIRRDIAQEVAGRLDQKQREYVLRQQMERIREELGDEPGDTEVVELRQRLDAIKLPADARKEAERELARLERLPPMAPEYHVVRGYLELLLDLPWETSSDAAGDTHGARRVLEADHHGLDDVKERILEHLAVLQLNPQAKAAILCFLGPPGVGKTSLGQSIARALGRKFERMSLGGVHDEATLRGHRRTYVGAMPGRIIEAIRRAEVNNPLLMLDEVDKLGSDFRGDPASALLEVLDPEQNVRFRDNYLDVPFDLSKVLFITTCNTLDSIPRPLLDRMEVVRLPGYSDEDKEIIAERYLIPRQIANAGLSRERFALEPGVVRLLIRRYTREAGVRQLERSIGRLARKVALRITEGHGNDVFHLEVDDIAAMLGPPPHGADLTRRELASGVAAGLAWTEAGGELIYVEAARRPAAHELTLTGQLGDVMQESAKAALTCVLARAESLGVPAEDLKSLGVHVHVPSGAVPKDGPSAGVTIVTALASLMSGQPVRSDTAMSGEITITGLVLPVGGIKEKLLAARRVGMARVVLPRDNASDLADVDPSIVAGLDIVLVDHVEEAWSQAIPGLEYLSSYEPGALSGIQGVGSTEQRGTAVSGG